jgi:proteasome lid subunit RPN8/RPN11
MTTQVLEQAVESKNTSEESNQSVPRRCDFHKYARSAEYRRRHSEGLQKIQDMVVDEINSSLEATVQKLIVSRDFSKVYITEDALEKMDTVSEEFCSLTDKAGIGNYELGYFYISDNINGNNVISDIIVPDRQVVTPAHCHIDGRSKLKTARYARSLGVNFMSWGHSHGSIDAFLSGEDRDTLRLMGSEIPDVIRVKVDDSFPYGIFVTPTIVVNARKQRYGAIQFSYKHLEKGPLGTPLQARQKVIISDGSRHEGLEVNVVKSRGRKLKIDVDEIRNQLLNKNGGVIIDDGRQRIHLADIIRQKVPADYKSLYHSVFQELEILKIQFQQQFLRYTEGKKDYALLMEQFQDLTDERERLLARLQELEALQNMRYIQRMESFYTSLFRARSKRKKYFAVFSKIIAGQHRATVNDLKKGNLAENPDAGKIWKWEDRLKALRVLYDQCKVEFADLEIRYIDNLSGILSENSYMRRYYRKQVDRILNRFYK